MKINKVGIFQMPTDVFDGDLEKTTEFIKFWKSRWDWDSDQQLNSKGVAMRTYLVKRKILSEDDSSQIYPGSSTNLSRKDFLQNKINVALEEFIAKKEKVSDNKIFDAFNSIQYWGAITGRTFYIKNGLTETNIIYFRKYWEINIKPIYLSILNELGGTKVDLSKIISLFNKIDGLGVSFGTKHLHFWSTYFKWENPLPIYDKNIFQLLRAEVRKNRFPTWSQYVEVVDEFKKLADKINLSSVDIERALFAYHSKVGIKISNTLTKDYIDIYHTNAVNDFLNRRLKT